MEQQQPGDSHQPQPPKQPPEPVPAAATAHQPPLRWRDAASDDSENAIRRQLEALERQEELEVGDRLLPRFTLRGFLILMSVAGFLSYALAQAYRGADWAMAIVWAGAALATCFFCYAVLFSLAYLVGSITRLVAPPQRESPFASRPVKPSVPTTGGEA